MATIRHSQGNAARTILALIVALGALWFFWPQLEAWRSPKIAAEPRAITPRGDLAADESNTITVFEQSSPAVAFITTSQRVIDLYERNVMELQSGSGSGFLWDDKGHIVTNYHVIAEAERAVVRLGGQRTYPAVLVGASPEHDLAVLRVELDEDAPTPLPVGSSTDLKVGQKVFAIGNPFGLDHTLTTGVISALDRSIEAPNKREIQHVIQTDAAINPGNSGGPLLDSAGRLIGINTAIYSNSGTSAGVGFAVPVDTINRVVPRLIAEGRYSRPVLGIQADDAIASELMEDMDEVGLTGVPVLGVTRGTPAHEAGLQPARITDTGVVLGDVIRAIDGKEVADLGDLSEVLDDKKVGQLVELDVWRGGQTRKVPLKLGSPDR